VPRCRQAPQYLPISVIRREVAIEECFFMDFCVLRKGEITRI